MGFQGKRLFQGGGKLQKGRFGSGLRRGMSSPPTSTTRLLDHFTDADGTDLSVHTMDIGGGWSIVLGTWNIQSNQANVAVGDALYTADASASDVTISLKVKSTGSTNSGLVARFLDSNNYWWLRINGGSTFDLIEHTSGIDNIRATVNISSGDGLFHTLSLSLLGTSFTGTLDGGNTLTFTSSVGQLRTKHGMKGASGGDRTDDFTVTTP